jgi:hypothetical protein
MINEESAVLKRLFQNETIKIKGTDGKKNIGQSPEVFKSSLDPDFKGWQLNKVQDQTKEKEVEVYEVVSSANFKTMFSQFCENSSKPKEACLTQHQIVEFCQNHKDYLQRNWATFFLFKENNEYFVARVFVRANGLHVDSISFDLLHNWLADRRPRLVIPIITS